MKIAKISSIIIVVALVGSSLPHVSCSSATPTDTPGVERMGRTVLRQNGPELWTVLGYRFATSQIGDEWMILEVSLSTPGGQVARVTREDVSLRTPKGDTLALPTQKEFSEAYGSLRSTIAKADIDRDPLNYFPPDREPCDVRFFVTPGAGVSFDEVVMNDRRACVGRLFFSVPGGIQAGRWVFGIDLPESEIRIPFDLEE